jgi:YD repeat-containing protein
VQTSCLKALAALCIFLAAVTAPAQTATYHLHNEQSTINTSFKKLLTAGPDAAATTATIALKNKTAGEYLINEFETQTSVPNTPGVIPSGSTVTFSIWMRKTASVGTVFARAKVRLNNATGALFCTATGSNALSTTVASQVLSCVTTADISMAATDRFYLWFGVNLTATSSSTFNGELDLEGTLNANFDSQISVPLGAGVPTISALTPSAGAINSSVVITGTNFRSTQLSGSTVKFNGTATVPSVWTSTSITAPIPSGVPTGNVPATVTVGGQTSAAVNFAVTPAPSISSLAPNAGAIGSSITISGANFNTQGAGSQVKFSGTAATIISWTTSSISVNVPAGAISGNVVVTDAGGVQTSGVPFTVTPAPSITGLSPNSGATGSSVTISGSNFNAQGTGSTVAFGGIPAATISNWSSNSITLNVPSGAISGNVVVTDAGGVTSNGLNFTVVVTPTITSLTPSSGEPGASVSIAGTNFTATAGTVTFNGLSASTTNWTNTSVTAVVPNGATSGNIVVTSGGLQSNGAAFTVLVPTINNAAPATGAAGTIVTLTGSNFGASAGTVTFAGQSATINSWADGSIQAVVPASASTGNIVVSHGGLQSNGVLFTVAQQTLGGPVSYSYDELGRLIGAVANSGDAIRYSYDAVGNMLSLTRYAAGQSTIFEFHPKSGPIGTSVSISGSNFSANPAQDTVSFNGTSAVVSSASTTSLAVAVPSGATTGTITVTSPSGSVTSSDSFTVTNSDGRPRVDSFSPPIVAAGTAVTITGANFDPTPVNNRLAVNVTHGLNPTSAGATSLIFNTPTSTGSGHISLSTPTGSVTTTSDLFIPPAIYSVGSVGSTGRTAPGSAGTVNLAAANQIGLLLFDGNKGQMVSAVASNGSTFSGCTFYIYSPSNSFLFDSRSTGGIGQAFGNCGTFGGFFDSQVLPITGTYALTVVPGTATGHATFTPYVFNDIQGGTLALGSAVTTTTSFPGQNANYNFAGNVNKHITISVPTSTFNSCFYEIINPDGTILVNTLSASCNKFTNFFDIPLLPQSGVYKLIVDPFGAETGSVTFKLNDATDVTGTITTDGTPVTIATTVPGQNAKFTFNGTAGQVIAVLLDNNAFVPAGVSMTILAPDGSTFKGIGNASVPEFIDDTHYCSNGFVGYVCGDFPLPTSGIYTLLLSAGNGGAGSARVRIFTVPVDSSISGSLGGPSIPITIGTPGQNGRVTFTGTQEGRVSVGFNNANFSGVFAPGFAFEILQPDGSLFAGPLSGGPFSFASASGFIDYNDTFTFPVTGTYTLILDPANDTTGTISISLYDATDQNLNISADGSANNVSISSPGQNGHFNFVPAIGQKVSALLTNLSFPDKPGLTLRRVDSSGTVFNVQTAGSDGSNLFMDAFTISQSGSYFLFLDPIAQEIGSGTLTLYTVSDINTAVDTQNDPVTVTTTVPGQNANLTFSANAGQSLTLSVVGSNFAQTRCHVNLQTSTGSNIASGDCALIGQWSSVTAPQTGTYTIVVDPVQSSTGSETVSMRVQ